MSDTSNTPTDAVPLPRVTTQVTLAPRVMIRVANEGQPGYVFGMTPEEALTLSDQLNALREHAAMQHPAEG